VVSSLKDDSFVAKRILIVDDNEAVRRALQGLFEMDSAFEVCGAAGNGREAIEVAKRSLPDLVILDLAMPVLTGIEAAPILIKTLPGVIVMLFTMFESPQLTAEAHRAGVHAVVPKYRPDKLLEHARSFLNVQ
jgi:two-component system, NarL family, nitrate/nitrite response regulator NarL